MELQGNIARFSKIIKSRPDVLSLKDVTAVVRAIVLADTAHLCDADRGKYEHLRLSSVADSGVAEFRNVCFGCNGSHRHERVSDVMQMRIMCDVLTILLNGNQPFAMRYSADVAKARGQRERTARNAYLEYEECEGILSFYYDSMADYDPALSRVFERTSYYLKELKRLQPKINSSKSVIKEDCVSELWLPEKFDSAGFKVCTKEPACFESAGVDKARYLWAYNLAGILDVLVRVIVRVDKGDLAKIAFIARLQDIRRIAPDCFPVGTDLGSTMHDPVYIPYHFLTNQALRSIYDQCFTDKQRITQSGVDATFKAIKTWYKAQ